MKTITCLHCHHDFQIKECRKSVKFCSRKCYFENEIESAKPRFLSSISGTGDRCWKWTGARNKEGYGIFRSVAFYGRLAHRVAWQIFEGPLPEGAFVLHKCDNPICVNPSHLFLGTQADNMRDMVNKSRQAFGTRRKNAKLSEESVRLLRSCKWGEITTSAKRLGISRGLAYSVIAGRRWSHVS